MAGLREAGHVTSGKGQGGGWQLAKPLDQITLLAVYQALGRPTLFAISNRSAPPDCQVQKRVNAALSDTMAQAKAVLIERFGEISLDALMPSTAASLSS